MSTREIFPNLERALAIAERITIAAFEADEAKRRLANFPIRRG
jgi:hypothetical protein